MLFVFRTRDPSKDLLCIVSQSSGNILEEILNLLDLEEAICKYCELPEGSLLHMCTIDDIIVLSWNFEHFTPCRKATHEDFNNVLSRTRLFEFKSKCPRGTVSMPFLSFEIRTVIFLMIQMIQCSCLFVMIIYSLKSLKVDG